MTPSWSDWKRRHDHGRRTCSCLTPTSSSKPTGATAVASTFKVMMTWVHRNPRFGCKPNRNSRWRPTDGSPVGLNRRKRQVRGKRPSNFHGPTPGREQGPGRRPTGVPGSRRTGNLKGKRAAPTKPTRPLDRPAAGAPLTRCARSFTRLSGPGPDEAQFPGVERDKPLYHGPGATQGKRRGPPGPVAVARVWSTRTAGLQYGRRAVWSSTPASGGASWLRRREATGCRPPPRAGRGSRPVRHAASPGTGR